MSNETLLAEALSLSPADRLELVEAIWDSISEIPDAVPLTEAQRAELVARLEDHRRNPTAGTPWEEVKRRLLNGL
jgi:putative addiction module component (TIGR02574 family)